MMLCGIVARLGALSSYLQPTIPILRSHAPESSYPLVVTHYSISTNYFYYYYYYYYYSYASLVNYYYPIL